MKNIYIEEELTSVEMTCVLGGGGKWVWSEESGDWHWID